MSRAGSCALHSRWFQWHLHRVARSEEGHPIYVYDPQEEIGCFFRMREAVRSQTAIRLGIDNSPNATQAMAIRWAARHLMDPVRERFGIIDVSSWLRVPELNRAVGSDDSSAHPHGVAVDFEPRDPAVTLRQVVEWVAASDLPFDQVIYEYGQWVHLGGPVDLNPWSARRQVLMKFRGTRYLRYDPTDPRVAR